MTPAEVVAHLVAMHTEVQRLMPHVGCVPVFIGPPGHRVIHQRCTCYKHDLLRALRDAEMVARDRGGMEPF